MAIFQLRTYHLTSAAAAGEYLPRWRPHIASLKRFGVETHGFFSVPSNPSVVVALVSYAEDADPDAVIREYMASEHFEADMEGFDLTKVIRVGTMNLVPDDCSPLS